MIRLLLPALAASVLFLLVAGGVTEAAAQQAPQQLRAMRHFWHVFIAYALAWLILFGWVLAIVRRIARVERRLDR